MGDSTMGIYSLPGLNVSIQGPKSAVRSALEVMFRMSWKPSLEGAVPLKAFVVTGNQIRDVLPEWLSEEVSACSPSEDVLMFYGLAGDKAAVAANEHALYCAWLSAAADELRYVFCKKTSRLTPLSVSSVLVPVLREALLARGGALLHGAALLCPNDTGIVISADSGGGKTTTALAVLRKGARILSDDLIVSQAEPDGVSLFGIPEPMNLTDQTIAFFKEIAPFSDRPRRDPISRKLMVSPYEVYGPDCMIDRCRAKVIYFVNVTKKGPFIKPMPTADALGKLIRSHTFARRQQMTRDSVSHLCGLLSNVGTYSLGTGPDPEVLGEWLIARCAEHAIK